MIIFDARVKKVGGSLALFVPPERVQENHLKEGDLVHVVATRPGFSAFGAYKGAGLLELLRQDREEARRAEKF